MNLGRQTVSATPALVLHDLRLDASADAFALSCPHGWAVYRAFPLELVRKRAVRGGTLALVAPAGASSLVFLVGGGPAPRYAPNKVVLWDDRRAREVAELEFRERVRGLQARRGWLAVALRRRVVVFEVGAAVTRYAEWDTCDNPNGLLAIATDAHATLLAVPGRQTGHVQLIHLPPCRPPEAAPPNLSAPAPPRPQPPPPPAGARAPAQGVLVAHNSALSTLAVTPSGRLVATTSARGTLVRVWDARTGAQVRELRRGSDRAAIYGVAFRPDEAELAVWSDKGTVHVFALGGAGARAGPANRQSTLSALAGFLPLPKYFDSEWSYAQWSVPTRSAHVALAQATAGRRDPDLPEEEKCTVGWIWAPAAPPSASAAAAPAGPSRQGPAPAMEYQLVALTYAGGWYRLALPRAAAAADDAASVRSGSSKGSVKGKGRARGDERGDEKEKKAKQSRSCVLLEYRRFGSWDGWG